MTKRKTGFLGYFLQLPNMAEILEPPAQINAVTELETHLIEEQRVN